MADLREVLNSGAVGITESARKKIKAGDRAAKIKVVVTGLTAAAAINITSAAVKAAAVITGITLKTGENLPAIGEILTLRVTAGTAAAGHRNVTDVGGTPAAALATISDNGQTLTFEDTLTAFILTYTPAPAVPLNTDFDFGQPS